MKSAHAYTTWARENGLWRGGLVIRPTEYDLSAYVADLALPGPRGKPIKYGTILGHLTGISYYWHTVTGVDPCKDSATGLRLPLLRRVLRGIRRAQIRKKKKAEPLTTDRLKVVVASALRIQNTKTFLKGFDDILLSAATSAAVYGLLRIGELVSSHVQEQANAESPTHDPSRNLCWGDVTIYFDRPAHPLDGISFSHPKPTHATILLKDSKTDVFRDGSLRRLYCTGTADCPVMLLHRYAQARMVKFGDVQRNEPFFVRADGKWLTRDWFTNHLKMSLEIGGLSSLATTGHSCRAGGACSLLAGGATTAQVQLLGRWSSSCFLEYLSLSPLTLTTLARSMASLKPTDMDHREREELTTRLCGIREMAE